MRFRYSMWTVVNLSPQSWSVLAQDPSYLFETGMLILQFLLGSSL